MSDNVDDLKNTILRLQLMLDDYERKRTKTLRGMISALELLRYSMFAMRENPPKTHVVVDHVERAIAYLKGAQEV